MKGWTSTAHSTVTVYNCIQVMCMYNLYSALRTVFCTYKCTTHCLVHHIHNVCKSNTTINSHYFGDVNWRKYHKKLLWLQWNDVIIKQNIATLVVWQQVQNNLHCEHGNNIWHYPVCISCMCAGGIPSMCNGGDWAPAARCMAGCPIIMAACCCSMAACGYCPNDPLAAEVYMSAAAAAPTMDAIPDNRKQWRHTASRKSGIVEPKNSLMRLACGEWVTTWRSHLCFPGQRVGAIGRASRSGAVRLVDHRLYDPPSRVDEPAEHTNQHVVVGDRNDVVKHQFHAK